MSDLCYHVAVEEYRKERATLSKGAELAGISIWDFISRMGEAGVEIHYDVEEFAEDLEAIQSIR